MTCLKTVLTCSAVLVAFTVLAQPGEKQRSENAAKMKAALTMRVGQWDEEAKLVRRKKEPAPPKAAKPQKEATVEVEAVKTGTALVVGDAITTGAKKGVTVTAGAVGVQKISPNSAVRYVSFNPPALDPTKKSTIELELTKGEVQHRTGKLASGSVYRSRSMPRLAASAGTAYAVRLVGSEFEVFVAEGQVKVALDRAPETVLTVGARQKTLVGQTLPAAPLPFTAADEARARALLSIPISSMIGYTDPLELKREDAEEIVAIDVRPVLAIERASVLEAKWRANSVVVPGGRTFWTVDRMGVRREIGKGYQFVEASKLGGVILGLDPDTKELYAFDIEGNKRFVASDYEGFVSLAPNGSRALVKLKKWSFEGEGASRNASQKTDLYLVSTSGVLLQRVGVLGSDGGVPEVFWRKAGKRLVVVTRWTTGAEKSFTSVALPEFDSAFVTMRTIELNYPLSTEGKWKIDVTASGRWIIAVLGDETRIIDADAGKTISIRNVTETREIPGETALFVKTGDGGASKVEGFPQPPSMLGDGQPPRLVPLQNSDSVPSEPKVWAVSPNGELITFRSSKTSTVHVADSLDLKRFSDVYVGMAADYECEWVSGDEVYYKETRKVGEKIEVEEILIKLAVQREGARPRRFPGNPDRTSEWPQFTSDLDSQRFIEMFLYDMGPDGTLIGGSKYIRGTVARSFILRPQNGGTLDYVQHGYSLGSGLSGLAKDGTIYGREFAILPDGRYVALPPGHESAGQILPNGRMLLEGGKEWDPKDHGPKYPIGDGKPYGGRVSDVPWIPLGAAIHEVSENGLILYLEETSEDRPRKFWIGDGRKNPVLAEAMAPRTMSSFCLGMDGSLVYSYSSMRHNEPMKTAIFKVGLTGQAVEILNETYDHKPDISVSVRGTTSEGLVFGTISEPIPGTRGMVIPADCFVVIKGEMVLLSERMGPGWKLGMVKVKASGALIGAVYRDGKPVLMVPNLYDLLARSPSTAPSPPVRPSPSGLPVGEYEGAVYRGGRRDQSSRDMAARSAPGVQFSLSADGGYRFMQGSSDLSRIEGPPILIAEGKATLQGKEMVLKPTRPGTSQLSVLGWRFDRELRLQIEADGSLSFVGRPNGATDPPPPGTELRLVKRS